mgnify:CR=1 FL=1
MPGDDIDVKVLGYMRRIDLDKKRKLPFEPAKEVLCDPDPNIFDNTMKIADAIADEAKKEELEMSDHMKQRSEHLDVKFIKVFVFSI